jgi:predicted PurR-regulated permease PerM
MSPNPLKVSNAFQLGLLGGLGVLTAILIGNMVVTIATVLTYVFASIFIALGLDPIVGYLEKRGFRRPLAILTVVAVVIVSLTTLLVSFVPSLISQTAHFIENTPTIISGFLELPAVVALDTHFGGAITAVFSRTLRTHLDYVTSVVERCRLLGQGCDREGQQQRGQRALDA